MLKIKDNVDLKELERYNFYELKDIYEYHNAREEIIRISKKTRSIYMSSLIYPDFMRIDLLYDLIKADLVEKVE